MKSRSFPTYERIPPHATAFSPTNEFPRFDRKGDFQIIGILIFNTLLVVQLLCMYSVKMSETDDNNSYNRRRDLTSIKVASEAGAKRVAVVIAGTLQRFQLNATVEHLLKPVAKQGHSVDYFISLTTAQAKAYRDDLGYMDKVHWDPIFSNGTISKKAPSEDTVEKVTRRSIIEAGGRLQQLTLRETVNIDIDKQLKAKRSIAHFYNPLEDPDARFPLKDVRNEVVLKRTINGNKNILRLMLSIHELWGILLKVELTVVKPYDYVMFLRDDTLWLDDIDFNGLIKGIKEKDAISLSCDARNPSMESNEMNDHGIVITRAKAKIIGNYYSEMFKADLNACASELDPKLSLNGLRGCNSEMILKWIIDKNDIKVHKVGQGQLPFQRSLSVIMPNGELGHCFHKYCQSQTNKLDDHGMVRCADIKYAKINKKKTWEDF